MSIKIIKQGVLTTLQDGGRKGFRNMGICPGGAMDIFAMAVSNFLVGNYESAAVLEINFPGPGNIVSAKCDHQFSRRRPFCISQ
ncbi:MAG: hypothetical protein IPP96_07815 [Chitinophagaceae bacterium]|nr:hypothetical protein [Chitinophagaceae bacterium]